ncbi:MAG: diaminopimelate decarboxylase, partial [Limnochordia bacterium]
MNYEETHNRAGHLVIGGCDVVELVGQWGTPLYVFDEEAVINNIVMYRNALSGLPDYEIIYAAKALLTVGIARFMANHGLSLDVVSGGELYMA